MDLGLNGRKSVVTGASRGIGLATCRLLATEGADVLMVARDVGVLRDAADEVRSAAGESVRIETIAADVTDASSPDRIVRSCIERLGGIEVLVNNAGASVARPMDELSDADWARQWELNVMAPMRLMRAAAPEMARRGRGRIVNVCSSAGKRPSGTNVAYSVTKAAELRLSAVFASELAVRGIAVNAVVPGAVATGLWLDEGGLADQIAALRGISRETAFETQAQRIPSGRFGEPDEVAAIVVLLCSSLARVASGAEWAVGFSDG